MQVSLPTIESLLLNEREAAKYLGISPRTLFSARKAGMIPAVVISERCIRYSRAALAQWVADQSAPAKNDGGDQ